MDRRVGQELEEARRHLAAIPGFSAQAKEARIARLPGLTNRVYDVALPEGRFALRIPGEGTAAIIDRRSEETNARAAAAVGVAPEVIHFGANGVMLTCFVEGAEPLSPERIIEKPGALERVAAALRHLHDSGIVFVGRFEPFGTIDRYRQVLADEGASPTAGQRAIIEEGNAVRAALAARPAALKPCHCDPSGRNLLDTGEKVWLIDWEYSGMNDPAWDLAYCSIQASLPPSADATLLTAYLGRAPELTETARMTVMKAPVELMSALWALIQDASGNRAADFRSYADRTFAQCAARTHTPEFQDQVRLVGGS